MFAKLVKRFRNFDREEKGLEALQVVMIIAIAAMVLISVSAVGKATNAWMGQHVESLTSNEDLKMVGSEVTNSDGSVTWTQMGGDLEYTTMPTE